MQHQGGDGLAVRGDLDLDGWHGEGVESAHKLQDGVHMGRDGGVSLSADDGGGRVLVVVGQQVQAQEVGNLRNGRANGDNVLVQVDAEACVGWWGAIRD